MGASVPVLDHAPGPRPDARHLRPIRASLGTGEAFVPNGARLGLLRIDDRFDPPE